MTDEVRSESRSTQLKSRNVKSDAEKATVLCSDDYFAILSALVGVKSPGTPTHFHNAKLTTKDVCLLVCLSVCLLLPRSIFPLRKDIRNLCSTIL